MAQVDLSNYKALYFQTAKEYVNSLLAGCDKLINNLQDKDAINQIHIASHSLKSQSQVMGFTDIASVSAMIEKTSNDILNKSGVVDDKFLVFLKDSVNELSLKLTQIEKTQ